MFTGIINALGEVTSMTPSSDALVIEVDIHALLTDPIQLGDSIAVNGVCLTVTQLQDHIARFDVSKETLEKTLLSEYKVGQRVNLETALTLETPLGGHLVSGHVDGKCQLVDIQEQQQGYVYQFTLPVALGQFVAHKGSVAIDGISLTSNDVKDISGQTVFSVALVPHTIKHTSLQYAQKAQYCHFEIDLLARYLQRLQQVDLASGMHHD